MDVTLSDTDDSSGSVDTSNDQISEQNPEGDKPPEQNSKGENVINHKPNSINIQTANLFSNELGDNFDSLEQSMDELLSNDSKKPDPNLTEVKK